MSHSDGSIIGLEHGKIGDRIAVVLNGKQIYKKLYKPTNPRTPKQQMHRAKIAFANKLSAVMAEAVNIGFALVPKPGSGQSPRNAFVKLNWKQEAFAWDEESGTWGIIPERLMVAYGPRFISCDIVTTVNDDTLTISFPTPKLDDSHAVNDDQLYVAVYRPAIPEVRLYLGPLRGDCDECELQLPEKAGTDDTRHVYAWFRATHYHRSGYGKASVRPKQTSPSVYLGAF